MPVIFRNPEIKITSLSDIRELERVETEQLELPASTYELIANSAARFGERVALRFLPTARIDEEAQVYSYRDLLEKVTQAANAFHALGVDAGTTVSTLLPNLPQTHFTIWGAEAAGIFNPINPLLEVEHIAAILNEAQTRVLVTLGPDSDSTLWEKAKVLQAQVPSLAHVLTVELPGVTGQGTHLRDSVLDFDALMAEQPGGKLVSDRPIQGSDIASYFHTGGTTGTPKLAPHTHFNEIMNTYQIVTALDAGENSKGLCGLPLFHVNGVFVTGLAPWMVGGEAVVATAGGYRTPEVLQNFWHLVEKYRVTFFSAVPTILSGLLQVPSERYDLSSLDVALCGAAPLATELIRKFEAKTGLALLEGYGQTEGTAATSANPRYGERRVGSVGLPLPYCRIRIVEVNEQGRAMRDCAVNEPGIIAISGPNVFGGYKQREQNEGQWVEEGWFNTGDLGRLDEDGYLWLTGRSKDLIIRGGHNIDPQMIEEAYYSHDKVAEAVAIGKPDKRVGELPIVAIQLKPGMTASEEKMIAYGRDHIHEQAAIPKEVHFVEAMPLTAVGKIFKPELRNNLIREQVNRELAEVLELPFVVSVSIDKKFGQSVTVSAPDSTARQIRETLGDYAFHLVVSSGNTGG